MTDQITNREETPKNRIVEIARKAFLWISAGLALFTIYRMVSKKLVTFKSCGTGSSRHRTELFYDLDPAPMRAGFPGGF